MYPSLRKAGVLAAVTPVVLAATYQSSDNFIGNSFFTDFSFEAIADPTHGRVNYVDMATAQSQNLSFASDDTFIMRADSTTVLSASGPGRNSVRIKSNKTYTTHVVIFDIRHMPQGCATWPAAWEVDEATWPNGGETDVVEGVNDHGPNQSTLHTSPGCTMSGQTQTGTTVGTDCNTADNGNAGCGVQTPGSNTYGPSFNNNGGGWYAMERTTATINVWFWPRNGSPPSDIANPGSSVDTDNWGEPYANFPSSSTCDIGSHFSAHNIIINLTLCGDFAGAVYSQDGCPGDCVDTVNNDPSSFVDAYWDLAAVRTYE